MTHHCRIDITTSGRLYPGNPGYVVMCDECEQVGQPQDIARDAHVIARRHEEIKGFERRR